MKRAKKIKGSKPAAQSGPAKVAVAVPPPGKRIVPMQKSGGK